MNYQNGKIYKLVSNQTDKIYVGSTTQPLYKRKSKHKSNYKKWVDDNTRSYMTSYEICKYGDCDIILIELFPCNSKIELHARERHFIETLDCVNKYIPGRTKKEYGKIYREENKEEIKLKKKKYRENNKEHLKQKSKEYYLDNKEIINQKKKKYQEDNKEEIKLKNKKYRENNKEKIKLKKNQKINCECGGRYTNCHKSRHLKTKKHKKWEEEN
jgi:hypothetical protein